MVHAVQECIVHSRRQFTADQLCVRKRGDTCSAQQHRGLSGWQCCLPINMSTTASLERDCTSRRVHAAWSCDSYAPRQACCVRCLTVVRLLMCLQAQASARPPMASAPRTLCTSQIPSLHRMRSTTQLQPQPSHLSQLLVLRGSARGCGLMIMHRHPTRSHSQGRCGILSMCLSLIPRRSELTTCGKMAAGHDAHIGMHVRPCARAC